MAESASSAPVTQRECKFQMQPLERRVDRLEHKSQPVDEIVEKMVDRVVITLERKREEAANGKWDELKKHLRDAQPPSTLKKAAVVAALIASIAGTALGVTTYVQSRSDRIMARVESRHAKEIERAKANAARDAELKALRTAILNKEK